MPRLGPRAIVLGVAILSVLANAAAAAPFFTQPRGVLRHERGHSSTISRNRPTIVRACDGAGRQKRVSSSPFALAAALALLSAPSAAQIADWPTTEGAPGGGRFSPLTEITRENVTQLRVAWIYRHGDFWEGN